MKLKEFGPPGGCASLIPPLRSATGVSAQGGSLSRGLSVQGALCPGGLPTERGGGGTHPTEMHSCYYYFDVCQVGFVFVLAIYLKFKRHIKH